MATAITMIRFFDSKTLDNEKSFEDSITYGCQLYIKDSEMKSTDAKALTIAGKKRLTKKY